MVEGKAGFHDKSILDEAGLKDGKLDKQGPLAQPPKQPNTTRILDPRHARSNSQVLKCPECGSTWLYKDGLRYLSDGTTVQRWLCRKCSYRFSEKRPLQKNRDWQINTASALFSSRQVCELLAEESKNLAEVNARQETAQREGTTQITENTGRIVEYLLFMKKKGRQEITLYTINRRLTQLSKHANLLQPEEIKDFLSNQDKWSNKTKALDTSIYSGFLKFHKIAWDPPEYKPIRKPYELPYEEDLEQLISGTGRRLSPFLLVLKETAARKGEAAQLEWTNIDFQRRLTSITPEKGGNPRTLPVSERLIEVLRSQKRNGDRVFNATLSSISSNYYQQRLKIAKKTGNPRLLKIGLHDFRHWKLTQIAHEFNGNAHYIQYFAGHKDLNTQQSYVHLAEQYYGRSVSPEFVVELAKNVEEAKKLIVVGFEFVHEHQGIMIYRKRK